MLVLALCWAGIGNAKAGNDAHEQELTTRPLLKYLPRDAGEGTGNGTGTGTIRPRQQILEYHPVSILDRLNLSEPAESANRRLSEVVEAVRGGADLALNWWNGDSGTGNLRPEPQLIRSPLPPRSTLIAPINIALAQQLLREVEDPYEPINRLVFGMNSGLQTYVLSPFSELYYEYTTDGVRTSVRHFFRNLREPVTIASSALAGNMGDAGNATARFGINTTLGFVGLFDPATGMGFARRPHDFEEMLCQYGLPSGPYIVLPFLGPATLRDAAARLLTVAAYFQVMGASIYVPYRVSDIAVNYVDIRKYMERLNAQALDPYIVHRTLYIAKRDESCGKPNALSQYFTR